MIDQRLIVEYHRGVFEAGDGLDWTDELRGKCVVANGCFDVLHPGHLTVLSRLSEEAVARDALALVLLNSDRSVRLIKGPSRPITSEAHRAKMLASLRWPLTVVIFDEETPQRIMDALQPLAVVKGSEYDGSAVVRWVGSEVVRVPMVSGYSTTGILNRKQ